MERMNFREFLEQRLQSNEIYYNYVRCKRQQAEERYMQAAAKKLGFDIAAAVLEKELQKKY